jgi:hypothetical protein
VKCGNPDCQNSHGPYLYAYWKHGKKLNRRYVGKNLEDFSLKIAKEMKVKPSLLLKFKFIEEQANKGNVLAKQYLEKLKKEEVNIDWAHRVLISSIRQQRMLKMMTCILLHCVKGSHEWQPVISELARYIISSILTLITTDVLMQGTRSAIMSIESNIASACSSSSR